MKSYIWSNIRTNDIIRPWLVKPLDTIIAFNEMLSIIMPLNFNLIN